MKLVIEAADLRRAVLTAAAGAEGGKATIPILAHLLFEALGGDGAGDRIRVAGTDMDLTVRIEAEAVRVDASGRCCPPMHELVGIVKNMPAGGQAELRLDDAAQEGESRLLHIACGRTKWRLACLPPDEFPVFAEPAAAATFDVATDDLRRLLDRTAWSISTEETRYYLNGIYLHPVDDQHDGRGPRLAAASTDGHRLTRADMALPAGAAVLPPVILPRRTVAALQRLLDAKAPSVVAVAASDTKLRFDLDRVTLATKVIDGTFPDYLRVIPARGNRIVHVDAAALAAAVQRVLPVSGQDKSRAVRFTAEPGAVRIDTASSAEHAGEDMVDADLEGDGRAVGMNSAYLIAAMAHFPGRVTWHWEDAAAPARFEDPDDPSLIIVVMPMRV